MDLLLIVRGLAALAVVVWHAVGYHGGFSAINVPGRTAVWIFFGISGYVIAHGFFHRRYAFTPADIRDFYINRVLRIYPLFLTLSLIGWATEYVATGRSPLAPGDVPAELFAVQFNHDYVLNGVFWTLGIELHFYIVAPLLAGLLMTIRGPHHRLLVFLPYLLMVVAIYLATKGLGWSFDDRNILMNLPHFLTGMIACLLASHVQPSVRRLRVSLAAGCALLVLTNWLYHTAPSRYWSVQGIVLVDLAIFFLVMAHASVARRRAQPQPVYAIFAFLGIISYGVYAWHGYLMKAFPGIAPQVFLLIVFSLCCAYASYRLIEKPALRLKRSHVIRSVQTPEGPSEREARGKPA